jgi:hypothetical protein
MRGVLDLLSPFAEETGCAFILAHHESKAPDSNGASARGASAIRDWCRPRKEFYEGQRHSHGATAWGEVRLGGESFTEASDSLG